MKRIFSFLMLAFVLISLGILPASAKELEKIPSPDRIKEYRDVIKRDEALYGVKLQMASANQNIKQPVKALATTEVASSTVSRLEKILTPALISAYEKITKIGNELWGIKKKAMALNAKGTSTPRVIGADLAPCVTAAIDVKDKALLERISATTADLSSAITTRSACQQTAVKSTENQRSSLEACVKTFNQAQKEANEKAKKAQQEIWKTYQSSLKACGAAYNETQGEIMIKDGSENLISEVTETRVK